MSTQPATQKRWLTLLFAAPPLLFLLLFFFYPLGSIFALSFSAVDFSGGGAAGRFFYAEYLLQTLWFTVWQAALSTALTLLLALPGAYVFARYRFWGKSLLLAMVTIPFVLPTLVVANAFTALLGPRGLLNQVFITMVQLDGPLIQWQHSLGMILLAHIFYNYAIVLRLVGGFWANLNPRLAEAGQMLGAGPWQTFRTITLPLLFPVVGAAALLIFIFCFTSFGVILVLGGPRYATLEVEIYRQAVNLFNLPLAASLALIQMTFLFVLMLVYTRLQARNSRPLSLQSRQATQKKPQTLRQKMLIGSNIALMFTLLGAPLAALVLRSIWITGGFSLIYYQALFGESPRSRSLFFVPPVEGIRNSLLFAGGTVLLATLLGLLVALALTSTNTGGTKTNSFGGTTNSFGRKKSFFGRKINLLRLRMVFDAMFMLPLAASAVTLGFGFIIALNRPPLNLRTSPLLVVIAHTLVALPFVVRSLLPAMRSIQPVLREAAAILGASPGRVWREVDLPIIRRALLVGAVFAFTISMGEFGATLFIARPDTPTMPVAIFRFLSRPGALNYGQALAMSVLLMLVCAAGFLLIERFRAGNSEF